MQQKLETKKDFEYKENVAFKVYPTQEKTSKTVEIYDGDKQVGHCTLLYAFNTKEYYVMGFRINDEYQKKGKWGSNLIEQVNTILQKEGINASLRNKIKGDKRVIYSNHGRVEDRRFPGKFDYKIKK